MSKPIAATEARTKLANIMGTYASSIVRAEECIKRFAAESGHLGGSAYLEFQTDGVWGGEATVMVDESTHGETVSYTIKISWSSTRRTIAMAAATLQNYQRALSLAAHLQAAIDSMPSVVADPPELDPEDLSETTP